jgi:hypothetical protein
MRIARPGAGMIGRVHRGIGLLLGLMALSCSGGGGPAAPVLVPAKYLVTVSNSAPTAGGTVTVRAQLATASGSSVPTSGRTVSWSKSGTGGTLSSATSTTDPSGVATVTFTTAAVVGSAYAFTATDNTGLTGNSSNVTTVVGTPSASASTVAAGASSIPANGTSSVVITVQLRDAEGTAILASGGTLTMSTTRGTLSAVTDSANGKYIATLRSTFGAQSATVTASLAGTPLTQSAAVNFVVGAAAKYAISTTPSAPVAGQAMSVSAQLLDANDAPVTTAGRVVTWSRSPSTGSFATATSTTDASGIATVSFTSDPLIATYTFGVQDNGSLLGSSVIGIRTVAGPGVRYSVGTVAANLVSGGTAAFTAQLRDANGNAALGIGLGKSATWSVTSGGGSFSSSTSPVDSAGVARTTLTISAAIGQSLAVTATDNGGLTGTSSTFTATAGTVSAVRLTSARVVLIDSASTSATTFQTLNEFALPIAGTLNYASRGGAASVSTSGVVTGTRVGQTLVVASDAATGLLADSLLVGVMSPTGPVVRTDLNVFDLKKDTVRTVTIVADMRSSGEKLGATTLQVLWDPTALTYVSDADGASGVGASVNATNAANGSLTLSVASASGFAGASELRRITFRVANATKRGTLQLLASEFVGAGTFTSLLARTLVISYPFYTR